MASATSWSRVVAVIFAVGAVSGTVPSYELVGVPLQHQTEQRLLVPERRVQARPVDAQSLGQVGDRGAFVALPPEHLHRTVERPVEVELTGTSGPHGYLRHAPDPVWTEPGQPSAKPTGRVA
jgi:hypothetical protein